MRLSWDDITSHLPQGTGINMIGGYLPTSLPLSIEPHRLIMILEDMDTGEHWTGIFYKDTDGNYTIDKLRNPPQ